MVNIYSPVDVEHSKSTDNSDIYTLNFDGVTAQIDHVRPSDEQLYWFKKGVLSERERIWDEGSMIDDNVLSELLHIDISDTEEYAIRVKLLDTLEVKWKDQCDLRFGQLIQNIMMQNDSTRYLKQNQLQKLSTVQWLALVENADSEVSAHSHEKEFERIPRIIESVRKEWISSEKSFGKYLTDHINDHQPGAVLYGYPDRFWLF